jgi:NADP-dependent 3-hydroxy acid dehydrogenase YdfG
MEQNQKVIIVTGASSGIGEAITKELAKAGHIVVFGARRLERLNLLAREIEQSGGNVRAHKLDVVSQNDFKKVVEATIQEFGKVDVLVNNAGLMPLSPLRALKTDEWNQMIDVNIKGVLNGIASVLPLMEEREDGHIINVASIGAHQVFPTSAVYCATKYAVWAISDGLRQETNKLRVTTIAPGVVESELANTITDKNTKEFMDEFRKIALKPDAIARAVLFAISQPKDVDISEIIVRPTASPY